MYNSINVHWRRNNAQYLWSRVIHTHISSYESELPPSLVSQVVTGVNNHLVELTSLQLTDWTESSEELTQGIKDKAPL